MNLLFSYFSAHREAVERLTDREVAGVEQVIEALEVVGDAPFRFDRELVVALRDEPLGPLLADGYLPILDAGDWRASAASAHAPSEPATDWVRFVEGYHARGVTVRACIPSPPRIDKLSPASPGARRVAARPRACCAARTSRA